MERYGSDTERCRVLRKSTERYGTLRECYEAVVKRCDLRGVMNLWKRYGTIVERDATLWNVMEALQSIVERYRSVTAR